MYYVYWSKRNLNLQSLWLAVSSVENGSQRAKIISCMAFMPPAHVISLCFFPLGDTALPPGTSSNKHNMAEFQRPASSSEQPTKSLASLSYVPEIVFPISVWQNPTDPSWTKAEDHLFREYSIFSSRINLFIVSPAFWLSSWDPAYHIVLRFFFFFFKFSFFAGSWAPGGKILVCSFWPPWHFMQL